MAIQWFPGHMNKARKDLAERVKDIDVVIEMLDARLPASSANPMIARMTRGKPALKILNKQDLADPAITQVWLDYYCAKPGTRAIALDAGERAPVTKLVSACRALAPNRGGLEKPLRVLICGIPNVGKSTLINSLTGRRIAKTGNEPGITKGQQRILLADDFELVDTPGMLWPKIEVEEGGYNLAASGAVGRNALDEEEVVLELLRYLMKHYTSLLQERYNVGDIEGWQDFEVLEQIGRRRGAMLGGGRVNIQKAAEIVLTDFRAGSIGPITLERPDEWKAWEKAAREREAQRQALREAQRLEREQRAKGSR
ncbi:ribosome biogenesis GTPase YlqF [Pseudogulbenkiania subflava]|uniref:Ribosome biogenesis GTPase A n=1 Tax=Pseudogulbenkiania subflava DSM 22618 TaxID=1123014 RepID=A0A1Y6C2U8_9NEIS|nr:ribosome biogenesis GTPase YlqF [Pseudogulbenkiania subflava]SMF40397.1 ribosome biogenesis GTPase A [Pseudogulbenkiania subflava DSM 22618]